MKTKKDKNRPLAVYLVAGLFFLLGISTAVTRAIWCMKHSGWFEFRLLVLPAIQIASSVLLYKGVNWARLVVSFLCACSFILALGLSVFAGFSPRYLPSIILPLAVFGILVFNQKLVGFFVNFGSNKGLESTGKLRSVENEGEGPEPQP